MEQAKKRPSPLVLVVEDEPYLRMAGASILQDAGFEVIEACNADEALLLLSANPRVGVVFTDVEMPGTIDGLGLVRLIHHDWPRIGVVVTSGRCGPTSSVSDADIFMQKPYRSAVLITEIKESMRRVLAQSQEA